ncbi:MAG TPA: hypothetical protein VF729_01810 [Solirubrobacterales bacterium]
MAPVREAWTDERLDDLNGRVADMGRRMDEGFNRVHEDLRSLRTEVDTKIDSLRGEMKTEIGALHKLILQVGGGMIATLVVGILSVVATQV